MVTDFHKRKVFNDIYIVQGMFEQRKKLSEVNNPTYSQILPMIILRRKRDEGRKNSSIPKDNDPKNHSYRRK